MFSFHRPKTYRSSNGCCICRAKSSSSRFTDSQRYENFFRKCFQVNNSRSGEICNACVLLVKRWQKLPKDSTKHWHHVVDARAGPGSRALVKKNSENDDIYPKKYVRPKKNKQYKEAYAPKSPSATSEVSEETFPLKSIDKVGQRNQVCYSPCPSDLSDDSSTVAVEGQESQENNKYSSFLDLNYWKKKKICCGIIFTGPNGEVAIDVSLFQPCSGCKSANPSHHLADDRSSKSCDHTSEVLADMKSKSQPQVRVNQVSTHNLSASSYPSYEENDYDLPVDLSYNHRPASMLERTHQPMNLSVQAI